MSRFYTIDEAKAANMPKDTIANAIKKGTGELGGENYEPLTYEAYAPGGIASLIMMNVRVAAHKKLHQLWGWYAALTATALVMLAGLAGLIELVYRLQLNDTTGSTLRYLGFTLDTQSAASWLGALAVAAIGFAAFEFVRRRFALEWGRIQGEIEETMTFKEPDSPVPEGGQAAAREASLGTP